MDDVRMDREPSTVLSIGKSRGERVKPGEKRDCNFKAIRSELSENHWIRLCDGKGYTLSEEGSGYRGPVQITKKSGSSHQ
jgi:sugar phosphate isomerase/epimerase